MARKLDSPFLTATKSNASPKTMAARRPSCLEKGLVKGRYNPLTSMSLQVWITDFIGFKYPLGACGSPLVHPYHFPQGQAPPHALVISLPAREPVISGPTSAAIGKPSKLSIMSLHSYSADAYSCTYNPPIYINTTYKNNTHTPACILGCQQLA